MHDAVVQDPTESFRRFRAMSFHHVDLGFSVDLSHMTFAAQALAGMEPVLTAAISTMAELEGGALANPDEERMVGHYWLRAPDRAPTAEIRQAIELAREDVVKFSDRVLSGAIKPPTRPRFETVVVVGIGGSSLGPMLVYEALRKRGRGLRVHFVDNTDPEAIDRLSEEIDLATTMTVVISKSGGTKETRNGMLEMRAAYAREDLEFGPHAVAVTQEGSKLFGYAKESGFIKQFPMWDWVGGRTSVTSTVGLLPTALAGADVSAFLAGAGKMDELTRSPGFATNPAALLAAAWHLAGDGTGARNMVLLPYKDRLALTSRYLQQLVMESLGKREDLAGRTVHQGLTVYGNKGSTDQHAYVQQLFDGPDDFFVTFIEVLQDREGQSLEVEPGVTSGDYLSGFLQGTRRALEDRKRGSITITLEALDATAVGAIIALYERSVGLYATLVNINAYHQPAVESGKKAAAEVLLFQAALIAKLDDEARSAGELASAAGQEDVVTALSVLRHLAANGRAQRAGDGAPWTWTFKRP